MEECRLIDEIVLLHAARTWRGQTQQAVVSIGTSKLASARTLIRRKPGRARLIFDGILQPALTMASPAEGNPGAQSSTTDRVMRTRGDDSPVKAWTHRTTPSVQIAS